ncbi:MULTISPECIES: nuclear transport factor 2 family protein [Mycobacterium]|uniref:DUF4440 domain-containing protein n=1 Tax=Mycobacterium colombiense TaxID=339268 RepID=A0A329LG61_9MYCO|nr:MULTISPECIES: nuclear transport factor 2 family protein [Mycobacterium]MDM4142751.1 nuclear transport factor 2 family protein [Mycobacterium sp. FLAC0960]RAV07099.1 DUF4440 domain-containing protein [Mycobacterium colombiense]
MSASGTATVIETANRLFAAIERSDTAAVDAMWSKDIAVWRSDSRRDPVTTDDKARAMRVIDWFVGATTQRRYEILDRQFFDDGAVRGFVQQHILHATGHAGQSISLRVCIVIRVDTDGLIERIEEYFDPAGIAPLLN